VGASDQVPVDRPIAGEAIAPEPPAPGLEVIAEQLLEYVVGERIVARVDWRTSVRALRLRGALSGCYINH
jgi:hypothetical protein